MRRVRPRAPFTNEAAWDRAGGFERVGNGDRSRELAKQILRYPREDDRDDSDARDSNCSPKAGVSDASNFDRRVDQAIIPRVAITSAPRRPASVIASTPSFLSSGVLWPR